MLETSTEATIQRRRLYFGIAAWGLLVVIAAGTGLYQSLPTLVLGPIIIAGMVLPTVIYTLSPGMRLAVASIGLRRLTAFQTWRIVATPLFLWYGAQGLLPAELARGAGWGDLVAGLLGLGVALLPPHRGRYLAVHLIGLADLLMAVATGLSFTWAGDPRMALVGTLPLALIPLFGVGVTTTSHLVALDLLRRGERAVPSRA